MGIRHFAALGAIALAIAPAALAGQFVYPAKGQTPAQQAKDEAACSTWAADQVKLAGAGTAAPSATTAAKPAGAKKPAIPGGQKTVETAAALATSMSKGGKGSKGLDTTSAALAALGAVQGHEGGVASAANVASAASVLAPATGKSSTATQAAAVLAQTVAKPKAKAQPTVQPDLDRARAACLIGRGYTVQ